VAKMQYVRVSGFAKYQSFLLVSEIVSFWFFFHNRRHVWQSSLE